MSIQLSLVDISGDAIAKSIRPLVIPHQSDINLISESILFLPWRFFGYSIKDEYINVDVHLIDDYKEFIYDLPITSNVELTITPPFLSMPRVYLSIVPKLTGLT